ncbi:EcsC family protein, partial [Intestinibacillus massiliensis]|nr:EcsC family protein [Intestinibacillus massiliensis]
GYDQKEQIQETAALFSRELLYLKFLQGIPIVGAAGGIYDAVYMRHVTEYANLKYKRRFLKGREERSV